MCADPAYLDPGVCDSENGEKCLLQNLYLQGKQEHNRKIQKLEFIVVLIKITFVFLNTRRFSWSIYELHQSDHLDH